MIQFTVYFPAKKDKKMCQSGIFVTFSIIKHWPLLNVHSDCLKVVLL